MPSYSRHAEYGKKFFKKVKVKGQDEFLSWPFVPIDNAWAQKYTLIWP